MYLNIPPAALLLAASSVFGAQITITRTVTGGSIPTVTSGTGTGTGSGNRAGVGDGSNSFTDAQTFQNDILAAHNFYRKQHDAPDLVWNTTSATFATKYSSNCVFEHSGGTTGENLVAGHPNAISSIDAFGTERQDFNFDSGGFSARAGHFTQLVWRNTTSVGCGVTSCQGKGDTPGFYVVCEYFPQGNIVGSGNKLFRDNVKAQTQGEASDTAVAALGDGSVGVQSVGGASPASTDPSSGASSLRASSISSLFSSPTSGFMTSTTAAGKAGRLWRESKGIVLVAVAAAAAMDQL
ncbi:CAP domain-containing protein [Amylocarpus encephaloides]|uniref:CAP domain-containing protein n=1 Tax=Amylocarpus encephaloides TaxID=45428 RepID=A0A9P8C984_9HELO|nr:CAP domain-containing protein [Amylocarpus encephaloides]